VSEADEIGPPLEDRPPEFEHRASLVGLYHGVADLMRQTGSANSNGTALSAIHDLAADLMPYTV
jgi:hypothetical protein